MKHATPRRRHTAGWLVAIALGGALPLAVSTPAYADPPAGITNGTIILGVNDLGQLNADTATFGYRGVSYVPTDNDGTRAGCPCEGWGAADAVSGATGFANNAAGIAGLTLESFTVTPATAVSITRVGSTLRVTQDYHPSLMTPNLYEVTVTIENTSAAAADVRYRRVMDWDIEPTPFSEFVTIQRGTSTNLLYSSDNGFETANALGSRSALIPATENTSFEDSGPADHGALFDFGFGMVDPGDSVSFKIFYGAAGTEGDAEAALGAVGAEVFSLGQPSTEGGPTEGTPNTFIFGFSGVGGDPVIPPSGEKLYGAQNGTRLVTFDRATPGSASLVGGFTGLRAEERIVGLDQRPATGGLYALGSTTSSAQLYTVNTTTAALTAVGSPFAGNFLNPGIGFDFNPVADRIRVVNTKQQNLRLDPDTGAVVAVDSPLKYAAGDPGAGTVPLVGAAGYTNSDTDAATDTTLYDVDSRRDVLVRQDPPNAGTLHTVGALGLNVNNRINLDVTNGTDALGTYEKSATAGSELIDVDLTTGVATPMGAILLGGNKVTLYAFSIVRS